MNFCSDCGHTVSLQKVEDDLVMRYVCTSCKTIHYQNPKIIAGCLPIWEDKVMLCKRAIQPCIGLWNLPGGFMENGETAEAGAAREVLEEANCAVEVINVHTVFSIPRINQVYLHFLAKMPTLSYSCGVESLEVEMFLEKDIPWKEIAFTSTSFALVKYFEDRKKGARNVHLGEYGKDGF